jgi:hypothetical protein
MIKEFKDEFAFLSNFYTDKDGFCVELHYQAMKFKDNNIIQEILKMTPGQSKKFTHLPENKPRIRKDWGKVSLHLMESLVRYKFSKKYEKSLLLKTYNKELIEGNYWHDNFYGHCFCDRCKTIPKFNHLGKIIMKIREEIRE